MRKVKNVFRNAGDWIDDHLRAMCEAMSPGRRLIVILTMLIGFSGLSLYMTISAIRRFGKDEGKQLQIEHIEVLRLELEKKQHELDSVKQSNDFYYEREQ
jgi:hypothetical protein